MKYYKIEKFFRGGSRVYYAKLPDELTLDKKLVDYQLQEWGESTDGGQAYGYNITMKKIKKLPKNGMIGLEFNKDYLTLNNRCVRRNIRESFINSNDVKDPKEPTNSDAIDSFIYRSNLLLKRGKFSMNNSLDKLPFLNDSEFKIVELIAKENGWHVEKFDDNYNTTSYKFYKRS